MPQLGYPKPVVKMLYKFAGLYGSMPSIVYQRTTEIRLLRWSQIRKEGIAFKPTKTENSSGGEVIVPISEDLRKVLSRAKELSQGSSTFVIHTQQGTPYTASGIRTAFSRAAERAGISGLTLKDIRSKAASDAKSAGYTEQQIQVGLVHSNSGSTKGYIKNQPAPVSDVILKLPEGVT
jgi:integrase